MCQNYLSTAERQRWSVSLGSVLKGQPKLIRGASLSLYVMTSPGKRREMDVMKLWVSGFVLKARNELLRLGCPTLFYVESAGLTFLVVLQDDERLEGRAC